MRQHVDNWIPTRALVNRTHESKHTDFGQPNFGVSKEGNVEVEGKPSAATAGGA
jgi:hypothetical protein